MLKATGSGHNIILQSDTAGVLPLYRKVNTGSWEAWNGTDWGGVPLPVNSQNFTDYNLSDAVYQYRFTLNNSPLYLYSNCVPLGSDPIGWTFRNYNIPEGQFGEILTPDDISYSYMWGIDKIAGSGLTWKDEQTKTMVEWAVYQLEKALNIDIFPRTYLSDDSDNADIEEVAHTIIKEFPYPNKRSRRFDLRMRHRPIREVTRLDFYSPVDTKIISLLPWLRTDKRNGTLRYYPKQGLNKTYTSYGYPWTFIMGYLNYPDAIHVDYTTGYKNAEFLPPDLRDIVGKIATLKMLNVIGDGLLAGFSSSSISLDGLSESFSSTQSSTSGYFGSRILTYTKDVEAYIEANRNKYGNFRIGSI